MSDKEEKTVIPFATYGMSGINWTMEHLKLVCIGAKIVMPFCKWLRYRWVQPVADVLSLLLAIISYERKFRERI